VKENHRFNVKELDQAILEKFHKTVNKGLKPSKKTIDKEIDWRMELTPKVARSILLIILLALIFAGFQWWNTRTNNVNESSTLVNSVIESPNFEETIISSAETISTEVVVYVTGDVNQSGVFHLNKGARAIDALEKAGGIKKGGQLGDVNLARILIDGEQIYFGTDKKQVTKSSTTNEKTSQNSDCINLNSASLSDLDKLPGVGSVLAQRIITWREENGSFQTVQQLSQVDGIGKSKLADITPKACV